MWAPGRAGYHDRLAIIDLSNLMIRPVPDDPPSSHHRVISRRSESWLLGRVTDDFTLSDRA